jgi:hypothetical protein
MTRRAISLIAVAVVALLASTVRADEGVTVTSNKVKDLNLRIYGFIETDAIADTTQGFNEEQDNNLVPTHTAVSASNTNLLTNNNANNWAGEHNRSQGSIRNSRLGFDLTLPKTSGGLATEAVFEMDLMGNQADNTTPGSGGPNANGSNQTEGNFFNNPTLRVRHAYMNLTYNDSLNAKIGQYWSLLGWQPYYFPGETIVMPAVGQLYRRFVQARATYTGSIADEATVEIAADAAKPPEMNSGNPETHAGLRLASTHYKAASIGGASTSMVGLSAGVSGAAIPIATAGIGNPTGYAYAVDVAIPIIASPDGKERGNNLIAMGEFMEGQGVGGLELAGASMGVSGVTTASQGAAAGTAIDSGIAGINLGGNVELIKLRSWRYHLQYVLPGGNWAVSGGYAQVEGMNLSSFASSGPTGANAAVIATSAFIKSYAGIAPKLQYGYVSVFWDALGWLRFAGEMNQTRDTYNDPNNRFATNNRYQLSAFFIF